MKSLLATLAFFSCFGPSSVFAAPAQMSLIAPATDHGANFHTLIHKVVLVCFPDGPGTVTCCDTETGICTPGIHRG